MKAGSPEPLGVTPDGDGVNVAVFSAHATAIELCLFDADGEREVRRVRLPERTGDVFHGHVAGVPEGTRYGLRAHGPYAPHEGHRFNASKLLIDPHARAIDRPFRLHASMFGARDGGRLDDTDSAPAMPKAIVATFEAAPAGRGLTPWPRTLLYELHVRGFTMRHPDVPEALRGTFAGLAHPAALDHLVRLGVTAVEIMPAAAWIEERHLAAQGRVNYWGYNPVAFMAPDPRLAPGGWREIRAAVQALANAGIETILDVVFNHTGEGDERGPTLSLRGLDNASYYRLAGGSPQRYVDDSGCGNTLALDRPAGIRLAMDSLRAWAALAGVHGFRFDLATVLGRRPEGFDPAAPLLAAIAQDPALRDRKLIAEPWDIGPGGYQVGAFDAPWAEWNDRFRDDVRRFWSGDPGRIGDLATRLAGSSDLFGSKRRPSRGVNYVVAHDGFTLADLVSYARKHNQANGEGNRDGTDANFSWNSGVEGPTADPAVSAGRARDQRALLATLLFARGTPMLAMGAELGHSQGGNNNAYAQDNETAWIDWAIADRRLARWTRRLIAIRRDHPALRDDRFLTGGSGAAGEAPIDVEWRRPDGHALGEADWQARPDLALVVQLCSRTDDGTGQDRVLIAFNRGTAPITVVLPAPTEGCGWQRLADSADDDGPATAVDGPAVAVSARSVVLLAEQPQPAARRSGATPFLARLARAAGIADEWWEIDGTRHVVSNDSKRALLAAMRMPVPNEAAARESLARLTAEQDLAPLPAAITCPDGGPLEIALPVETGLTRRPVWLEIALESGGMRRIRVGAEDGALKRAVTRDGREYGSWRVALPPLPIGRHRLRREDCDDACTLTVAPPRCYLPPPLAEGERRFGIAAQLYSLRRSGDQGIGDFTTLAELARATAGAGGAVVALNPLHALFAGQRHRASPYHPSDRRFLDSIYLDLGAGSSDTRPDVDYPGVWARKLAVLRDRFAALQGAEAAEFARFVAEGGEALERFAAFEAIAETRPGEGWQSWPEALRNAGGKGVSDFIAAHQPQVRFHQYLQFLCERQLAAAAESGRSAGLTLGLLRDLAVGAAPDGAEAWASAELLAPGVSVGAPPDPFSASGQIWSLPPPDPLRMARDGFASFAGLLAANMRHAGGLRIDHVMGLSRLFWVPDGGKGADGAYVAYPFHDLLGQVALESQRARCLVVGEDLGTVPEGFRQVLKDAAILSYRVLLLERDGGGFARPSAYPANALACVSTHDLPTLAGWWAGADIDEQAQLGLIAADGIAAARSARGADKAALQDALRRESISVPAGDDPPSAAVHAYVARTPSALAMVQADDLAGETRGVNLPGTDRERRNWRRRLAPPVADLLTSDTARSILDAVRDGRTG